MDKAIISGEALLCTMLLLPEHEKGVLRRRRMEMKFVGILESNEIRVGIGSKFVL